MNNNLNRISFKLLNKTPLFLACNSGNVEIVKILLAQNGINVNYLSI